MRFKTVGNQADSQLIVVRNAETSLTIPAGTPVIFNMNGTNDGLDVVLPNTAGASKIHSLNCGVVIRSIPPGEFGESLIYGVHPNVVYTRATRGASTDSWASQSSIPSYVILTIESVANGLASSGGTQAATAYFPNFILAQSLASYASSASATSDTRTAITTAVKAFVRML